MTRGRQTILDADTIGELEAAAKMERMAAVRRLAEEQVNNPHRYGRRSSGIGFVAMVTEAGRLRLSGKRDVHAVCDPEIEQYMAVGRGSDGKSRYLARLPKGAFAIESSSQILLWREAEALENGGFRAPYQERIPIAAAEIDYVLGTGVNDFWQPDNVLPAVSQLPGTDATEPVVPIRALAS